MPPVLRQESTAWRSQSRLVWELISQISQTSDSAATLVAQHISHISLISHRYPRYAEITVGASPSEPQPHHNSSGLWRLLFAIGQFFQLYGKVNWHSIDNEFQTRP